MLVEVKNNFFILGYIHHLYCSKIGTINLEFTDHYLSESRNEGKPMKMRRFWHNLLIQESLQAYSLTLPLLGFKSTWYEINCTSRDMNEKGNNFIFYNNHICLQQAFLVHCTWCLHSVGSCSYPSTRSACTHTVALPAAAWAEGWRVVYPQIYSPYSLWMIDLSLTLIWICPSHIH